MESILARALEYTLKYWLKSFSRDQFKLQGRTVQLSNLDINGDALHSSVGLPPALNVTTAKVGKLEIALPSVSNVQVEPIVVQIDRLDLVLEENTDPDACASPGSSQPSSSSARGSGYGFADKIADGMTLEVGTVNLMLETRGGAGRQGGATWTPPMAAITIRNLILQTTNENWQVVNLKEARDFSSNKKFIYVFKKLEWQSLSIDLLPHPDMFMDERLSEVGANRRDDDGARRIFFGGERFLEGISGQAYITIQRTQLNDPLGLEVQLRISEAVCPALSEPGLRALLRFLTGIYVCLNRGDVDPMSQRSTEAAGRSLVSIIVDHIFLCTKDSDFRLELLMQSLFFSRASISDGEKSRILTKIMIDGFFLRDTFSLPPCTLIQPSMQITAKDFHQIPEFAKNFCPPIFPFEEHISSNNGFPFISIHSLQDKPTPAPPLFASETVIHCQPLMVHLQEESCLRISSFLADGIVVSPGSVLPEFSVNSLAFTLRDLDLLVPLDTGKSGGLIRKSNTNLQSSFSGARLHVENLFFYESPALRLSLLDLEKDPACLCLWEDQPVDAGQNKWTSGASNLSLSLETHDDLPGLKNSLNLSSGLWRCVELKGACIEVAMTTPDGSPLVHIPPPEGVVRVGIACEEYLSNTSVEQLFFVLDLFSYFGEVSEKIATAGINKGSKIERNESSGDMLLMKVPSDSAISLAVGNLQLRFLEDSLSTTQGNPLVQFVGDNLFTKVSHRTLGGAIAVSSSIRWDAIEVDCVDAERSVHDHGTMPASDHGTMPASTHGPLKTTNGCPDLKAVLWVNHKTNMQINGCMPFLNASVVHVVPFDAQDAECHSLSVSACIAGVRLGGGMTYAEALLHRFGILGCDGGPGEGLTQGLQNLSAGPLSKIFKGSPLIVDRQKENGTSGNGEDNFFSQLGKPDDVDVSVVFRDWLFALEGAEDVTKKWVQNCGSVSREERCWHTSFQNLRIEAKNSPKGLVNGKSHGLLKSPVDLITICVEGLQTVKPLVHTGNMENGLPLSGFKDGTGEASGGVNLEARMIVSEDFSDNGIDKWVVENLRFSVEQPIEAVVTKDELQHLAFLSRTEVDSMGRIIAGILRVFKLEGSIGQSAIDKLSNLGSEGIGDVFGANPKILESSNRMPSTPSTKKIKENQHTSMESVVASLEGEIEDSQAKCVALIADLGDTELPRHHLDAVKQLGQKLESMRSLLTQLRTKS